MDAVPGAGARRLPGPGDCEQATLADGSAVVLRPIRPADGPFVQAFLLECSERTRYQRFLAPRGGFSPDELRLLTHVDGQNHFALTAFAVRSRRMVAVGRFIREGDTAIAEFALVVADAFQGKGLGQLLLSRMRDAALALGVLRFTGSMLDDNHAMRGLLRKLGGRSGLPSRGVCEVYLPLRP